MENASLAYEGFNPCFCGTRPRRLRVDMASFAESGFNPCFCGTRPRSSRIEYKIKQMMLVSILVFVELALGDYLRLWKVFCILVSILVFVELALGA